MANNKKWKWENFTLVANYVSNEAMLCPMTMYELGKCQKLSTEMKVQMDSANAMNAQLLAEKQRLENQLAVSPVTNPLIKQKMKFSIETNDTEIQKPMVKIGAHRHICIEQLKRVLLK